MSAGIFMERRAITIRGIVQGVGFRPFVFRLASDLEGLLAFVRATCRRDGTSVRFEAAGDPRIVARPREVEHGEVGRRRHRRENGPTAVGDTTLCFIHYVSDGSGCQLGNHVDDSSVRSYGMSNYSYTALTRTGCDAGVPG